MIVTECERDEPAFIPVAATARLLEAALINSDNSFSKREERKKKKKTVFAMKERGIYMCKIDTTSPC